MTNRSLADERALAKTISCVFHNALKFTETGRICLDVNMSPSSQTLVIVIADTGSGIPENFQEKIFKAYSQADESITRHSEGLGLGLLIAKGLAQKMGGDLDLIRSEIDGPNKGTVSERFWRRMMSQSLTSTLDLRTACSIIAHTFGICFACQHLR